MLTATIIGSGPNGLSAAIVLAAAGFSTTVFDVMFKSEARAPLRKPRCRTSVRT
jgi:thioredoxin reductase